MIAALGLAVATLQAAGDTHVLIVTGVGGEPAYATAFVQQGAALAGHLERRWGIPAARITWLAEDPARDPRIAGRSTRERVEQELLRLAGTARAGDRIVLALIGHGSEQNEPRFNLPGPDIGAADLERLLAHFRAQTIALVVAASASGGFVDRLAGPNRVIVTATRSGLERNETRFGAAWVRALGGGAADMDKDGALSLFETFTFARTEVAQEYERANRLLTEHARISDSALAARFLFAPPGARVAATPGDSVLAALLERKRDLEARIDALRRRRGTTDPEEYERALEDLLLDLARTNQAIRQRGGTP